MRDVYGTEIVENTVTFSISIQMNDAYSNVKTMYHFGLIEIARKFLEMLSGNAELQTIKSKICRTINE